MCCLALADASNLWPFAILGICVATIIVLISVLRMHAFLALILTAVLAGALAPVGSLPGEPKASHWVQAVELTTSEFGIVAGKIGVVIALASIIGVCVMEKRRGGQNRLGRFLAVFGEERAGLRYRSCRFPFAGYRSSSHTFHAAGYRLARAMALRTKKDYTLYVLSICCAGALTHTLVAPHPGPIAMAEILQSGSGLVHHRRRAGFDYSGRAGLAICQVAQQTHRSPAARNRGRAARRPRAHHEQTGELTSLFHLVHPPGSAADISGSLTASFLGAFGKSPGSFARVFPVIEFLGNRNIALLIGTFLAMLLVMRQKHLTLSALGALARPGAGTGRRDDTDHQRGGAFGGMLKNAGVGEAISDPAASGHHVNLIPCSRGLWAWC